GRAITTRVEINQNLELKELRKNMSKMAKSAIYGATIAALAAGIPMSEGILPADAVLERHGEVSFANETRFNESNFQQPLTDFAVGWRDPGGMETTLE